MNEIFDFQTIMILAAAVFVLLKLRSILGQRTGYQQKPMDQAERDRLRKEQEEASGQAPNDNVVPMTPKGSAKSKSAAKRVSSEENPVIAEINKYAKPNTKLNKGLKAVAEKTNGFAPGNFINGSKMAYEMIVTAFAEGDTKTLKTLLSKEVYEGFASAIKERKSNNETMNSTFVGIESADIKAAELVGSEAHLTVQFISQIISSVTDKDGKLIDGDPEAVSEVNDIWTFARSVNSKDPNWKLIATESEA